MLPRPVLSGKGFPWIERRMRTGYPEARHASDADGKLPVILGQLGWRALCSRASTRGRQYPSELRKATSRSGRRVLGGVGA